MFLSDSDKATKLKSPDVQFGPKRRQVTYVPKTFRVGLSNQ